MSGIPNVKLSFRVLWRNRYIAASPPMEPPIRESLKSVETRILER